MKKGEKRLELKVGFFMLFGIILVSVAILVLGGANSFFTSRNNYHTHFDKVDGLVSGAKVVLSGLQIGSVHLVDFDPESRDIRVEYSIKEKYSKWIRTDSRIEIVTQGVLGDKYLSIKAGHPAEPMIQPEGEIPAGSSSGLSQLLTSSENLMMKLTSTAENLEEVLTAFNRKHRSERFFESLAGTTENMHTLSASLNSQLSDSKLKSALGHLDSILEKIDHGQGTIGAFINDPGLYDDAKALIGQVNRNRILRNLVRQTIIDGKKEALENNKKSN